MYIYVCVYIYKNIYVYVSVRRVKFVAGSLLQPALLAG